MEKIGSGIQYKNPGYATLLLPMLIIWEKGCVKTMDFMPIPIQAQSGSKLTAPHLIRFGNFPSRIDMGFPDLIPGYYKIQIWIFSIRIQIFFCIPILTHDERTKIFKFSVANAIATSIRTNRQIQKITFGPPGEHEDLSNGQLH
jgi:hypothetical protein